MPSEAQLKSQMQAAIAKKKKEQESKPEPVVEAAPLPEPTIEVKKIKVDEPKSLGTPIVAANTSVIDRRPPVNQTEPIDLSYYGFSVRYTTYRKYVYFAIIDLLPLSKQPNYENQFIEFKNNPKTKDVADSLMRVLTFPGPNGSQKTEGAVDTDILAIFRELKYTAPGSLGRWLRENTTSHKPASVEEVEEDI